MEVSNEDIETPRWNAAQEAIIRGPYEYLVAQSGKQLRTSLISSFNQILHVEPEKLEIITKVIATLHNASLLIDDVEDGSKLRRGNPVAHEIFGVPMTINTSNYMYFEAIQEALRLGPEAIKILNQEFLNLHRGQCLDLFWRDNLICPTEKEYVDMVMNKTGGLFRLSIRLMELQNRPQQTFVPLVNLLGIMYQIKDDYINLSSSEYFANKGYCEDLKEGKFSFPIIHAIRFDEGNKEVLNILKKHTDDPLLKGHVVEYMKNVSHSFAYCEETLKNLQKKALGLVEALKSQYPPDIIELLKEIIYKMSDTQK